LPGILISNFACKWQRLSLVATKKEKLLSQIVCLDVFQLKLHPFKMRNWWGINMLLCAYPHTPTYNNIEEWDKGAFTPPQQQQQNNLNQKTKQPHNQKMGWEHCAGPHPHRKKKLR
jgi:hypothetical protein